MTDWTKVAAGVDPAIEVEKIRPVLEALENAFQPLVKSIPAGAEVWTGPEDVE
jgi:hypothetical protein